MRAIAALAAALSLTLVLAVPAEARRHRHPKAPCSAKRSTTLLSSGQARVRRLATRVSKSSILYWTTNGAPRSAVLR
jgi:hypothetical protein